jgi:hypothetical protein
LFDCLFGVLACHIRHKARQACATPSSALVIASSLRESVMSRL